MWHAVKTCYIVPSMNSQQTRQKTPSSPVSVNLALRDSSVNQVRSSTFMCWKNFKKKSGLEKWHLSSKSKASSVPFQSMKIDCSTPNEPKLLMITTLH